MLKGSPKIIDPNSGDLTRDDIVLGNNEKVYDYLCSVSGLKMLYIRTEKAINLIDKEYTYSYNQSYDSITNVRQTITLESRVYEMCKIVYNYIINYGLLYRQYTDKGYNHPTALKLITKTFLDYFKYAVKSVDVLVSEKYLFSAVRTHFLKEPEKANSIINEIKFNF